MEQIQENKIVTYSTVPCQYHAKELMKKIYSISVYLPLCTLF